MQKTKQKQQYKNLTVLTMDPKVNGTEQEGKSLEAF